MKQIDLGNNSYKDSLIQYAKEKDRFVKIQKAGYYLGFIFSLAVLPVAGKLMRGEYTDLLPVQADILQAKSDVGEQIDESLGHMNFELLRLATEQE